MDYAGAAKIGFALLFAVGLVVVLYRIRGEIRKAAKTEALEEGAKRRDKADEVLAQPVAKGGYLLERLRARSRARMRGDLDK